MSDPGLLPALITVVVGLLVLFILPRCIGRVGQEQAGIVERLGRYHRTLSPGVHLLLGPADRLRRVDLREQRIDLAGELLISSDNRVMSAEASVTYQVEDPLRATYAIANAGVGLEQLTRTTLRNLFGELDSDRVRAEQRWIVDSVRQALQGAAPEWGLRVLHVEVTNIQPHRG